jgi:hypothetical protein
LLEGLEAGNVSTVKGRNPETVALKAGDRSGPNVTTCRIVCILSLLFGPVLALGNTRLGACQMSELEEFDKAFFVNTREKVERFGH